MPIASWDLSADKEATLGLATQVHFDLEDERSEIAGGLITVGVEIGGLRNIALISGAPKAYRLAFMQSHSFAIMPIFLSC